MVPVTGRSSGAEVAEKCIHIKEDGNRCGAWQCSGSKYCTFHDPKKTEVADAMRVRGGSNWVAGALGGETIDPPRTPEEVKELSARVIKLTWDGLVDPKRAEAIVKLCNLQLRAMKAEEASPGENDDIQQMGLEELKGEARRLLDD